MKFQNGNIRNIALLAVALTLSRCSSNHIVSMPVDQIPNNKNIVIMQHPNGYSYLFLDVELKNEEGKTYYLAKLSTENKLSDLYGEKMEELQSSKRGILIIHMDSRYHLSPQPGDYIIIPLDLIVKAEWYNREKYIPLMVYIVGAVGLILAAVWAKGLISFN